MKYLFLSILIFFMACSASAQHWQRIVTPWTPTTTASSYQVPYFLNSELGFVYSLIPRTNIQTTTNYSGVSNSRFYKTTNGGQSWTFVHPFDSTNITIQQIYFTSLSHGFIV